MLFTDGNPPFSAMLIFLLSQYKQPILQILICKYDAYAHFMFLKSIP